MKLAAYMSRGGLGVEGARLGPVLEQMPKPWQDRIEKQWRIDSGTSWQSGVMGLLRRVAQLSDSARGGIPQDASDVEISEVADKTAADFSRRLETVGTLMAGRGASEAAIVRMKAFCCRELLRRRGMLDMWPSEKNKKLTRAGRVRRMECARWWRRTFRKLHARTVEACNIELGMVHREAGLYASDDRVQARAGQNQRNKNILDSIVAVNDRGHDYTLAMLASKGMANKTIRRQELLTRVAGFELISKDCGHVGYMVTMTCPSRFHARTTVDGRSVENKKFCGATPNEAQQYLSKQWSKCRSAAARRGMDWYGFRIAEPQHDATPHWHCLLFFPADKVEAMKYLVSRYFLLNDSPNEPGAQKHRVDFERIDPAKGSAVGYVIKYIAKNIDGHGVGEHHSKENGETYVADVDLVGDVQITPSQRVETWASTWRIRQFQQIGGAPVGVWRELRRVHPDQMQADAPAPLIAAMSAINVGKVEPGAQSVAWSKYNRAQGGVSCKRDDRPIKLHKVETGECGRYGEAMGAKVLGIVASGVQLFKNHIHAMDPAAKPFQRLAMWTVESERAEWATGLGIDAAMQAAESAFSGRATAPWIHVNNCTRPDPATVSSFAPVHEFKPKKRQFFDWTTATGTDSPDQEDEENEIYSGTSGQGG